MGQKENPELDPHMNGQLFFVFFEDAKAIQWRKNGLQQIVLGKLDIHTCFNPHLLPH